MDYTVFIPVLISFALSVIMGPVIIPVLRRLKMGQTEREDGVQSHLKKAGTPDHGWCDHPSVDRDHIRVLLFPVTPKIIPILFVTLGFGLIGFLDDYLKVVMKRSDGLYPKQKMALQIVVTCCVCILSGEIYRRVSCHADPVFRRAVSEYRLACDPAVILCGDRNGQRRVNFTDGLDGLASSVTVLVATFFTVAALGTDSGISPHHLRGSGSAAGIPSFQCLSGQCVYGRYRFPGAWRICSLCRLHAADAHFSLLS